MRAALVDGNSPKDASHAIAVADRGLNYGDGLFETMLLQEGRIRRLDAHLRRLSLGCLRLGITYPGDDVLAADIDAITAAERDGVVKIVVTRGAAGRGYRPALDGSPTRIVTLHDVPLDSREEIRVRWCEMRLSRNPALAGIKHLNRLEQVQAQREWSDAGIAEGLMLDYEGELVCATAANVFLVRGRELATPDLRYCGVRGIMRETVIVLARQLGLTVNEEPLWPDNLETADELFLTSSVRGIRAVVNLESRSWPCGPVTRSLQEALVKHA